MTRKFINKRKIGQNNELLKSAHHLPPRFFSMRNKRLLIISILILVILCCCINSAILHRFMTGQSNMFTSLRQNSSSSPMKRCATSNNNDNHLNLIMSNNGDDDDDKGKKEKVALVTGAAGFIGSYVAQYCATKLKMKVVAVDDMSGGYISNIPIHSSVHFHQGDVKDAEFLDSLFQLYDIDYVYHLAAYAAGGMSHYIRSYNYRNNLVGSAELVNAAIKTNVDCFVFISSVAVYGTAGQQQRQGSPILESTTPQPDDPYGISKYATEVDLKAAKDIFDMDYIIFRPHNVYGPNQNLYDKYRNVIGLFMEQILSGKPLTIFGDGSQTRSFSYIDDVVPIIAQSPLVKNARNEIFNVGADQSYTINELAKQVPAAMGRTENINVQHLPAKKEVLDAVYDHSKVRCYFDPPPPTSLHDGLAKMVHWVKSQRDRKNPIEFEAVEVMKEMPPTWIKPGLKEQAKFIHTGDDIITNDECGPRSVAMMISGQLSRFVYQDGVGPLLKMPKYKAHKALVLTSCPPPIIDVYILMHNGTMTKPNVGIIHEAPYLKDTNISTIEDWYKHRGANRVFIKMLDDEHMKKVDADLIRYAKRRNFDYKDMFADNIDRQYKKRWKPYSRQWYMRHHVYTMTLQQQRTYKAYITLRDDNYFAEPLDMTRFHFSKYEGNNSSPYVITDSICKWGGQYNDKVYITNQLGATLLFQTTWLDFVSKIIRWAMFSFIVSQSYMSKQTIREDPFWTEYFLQDMLTAATVEDVDLRRIDVRYQSDKLCVANGYWSKCSGPIAKQLTAAGIAPCVVKPKK